MIDIKEVENLVKDKCVILTGIREGEIIQGTRTQSKNAIIKIVKGNVPPSKIHLNKIRKFDELYSDFLTKIKSIPFFRNLTKLERHKWLKENESSEDIYLSDLELMIDVIDVGDSDFLKLDLSCLDLITCTYPISYLYYLFPKKPTSDGIKGRHTLIFRRSIWKVVSLYHEFIDEYDDLVIDPNTGTMNYNIKLRPNQVVFRFDSFISDYEYSGKYIPFPEKTSLGIVAEKSKRITENDITCIIQEIFPYHNIEYYYSKIKDITKNFSPSEYKSLLQKIIRKRSERCIFYEQNYRFSIKNEIVLCCIIGLLILHPGSFVPDIQRFVRGNESAFKRTLVTLYEDSIISDEIKCIRVVCYAFLCQRIPKYNPPKFVIKDCMELAVDGLNSPKAYKYKFDKNIKPYTPDIDLYGHQIVSLIIDELKSFETDLLMIRYISFYEKEFVENNYRDRYMEIYHYIDFHCQPNIIYYLDLKWINLLCDKSNTPYNTLFRKLFHQVTGVNPRRDNQISVDINFVKMVKKAQKNFYDFKISKIHNIDYEVCDHTIHNFKLDDGILAGMLGSIGLRYKNTNCLIQLSPKDPNIVHVIKKPSRTMENPFLDEKDEQHIIELFNEKLKKGIKLRAIPPIVPSLINTSLKKDEDFKIITPKKREVDWSKVSKQKIKIPLFKLNDTNIKNIVNLFLSENLKELGFDVDYKTKLTRLIKNTPKDIIFRVLYYLNTKNNVIEMTKVSRDGGGTSQIPIKEDIGAFKILCKLSILFPIIFTLTKPTTFQVYNICLLEYIRRKIYNILNIIDDKDNFDWGDLGEKNNRKLFNYQKSCINEMIEQYKQGRKGCFLWLDVGLGKTLIVMYYLKYLINKENIEYIIYTLPSSAIESVIQEIEYFGFEYNIIVPIKSKKYEKYNFSKNTNPKKFKINLVEHDHIRRCCDNLIHYMNKSVFIIDEVHKSLNESKRTSVCLNLSKLSKFFVALTGTPIIDSNTYKLMWWLEQIVPFQVNAKNFWVATHSMISKKLSTGIKCIYKDVELEVFDHNYDLIAPVGVGGLNMSPRHSDIIKAMNMCYDICNKHIAELALDYYNNESGCFIITRNQKHMLKIYNLLISKGILDIDIFMISKDNLIYFTDETVKNGETYDYKIVITTLNNSTGYTITRLSKMITSVYPSNNATREQLEGRINRVSQNSDSVEYTTVHCGILSYIYHKHKYTKSLSLVLKELCDEI